MTRHLAPPLVLAVALGACMPPIPSPPEAPAHAGGDRLLDLTPVGFDIMYPALAGRALLVPARDTLLVDGPLQVAAPAGERVPDATAHAAAMDALRAALGARWLDDVAAAVTAHDHLVSVAERERHRAAGYTIVYDAPGAGYVALDARVGEREVHATGQLGGWLALFVATPLPRAAALADGMPAPRPVDARTLVAEVAPALAARAWAPDDVAFPASIFDTALRTSDGATLRGGVRMRGSGDAVRYWYAVRVNVPRP